MYLKMALTKMIIMSVRITDTTKIYAYYDKE